MSITIHNIRRANLLKHLAKSNISRSEFARKAGISRSYLSQVLSEGFRFGEKAARNLENSLRLPKGALDLEQDQGLSPVVVWDKPEDLPEGAFAILTRISIKLSAGDGVIMEEEMDSPPLAFRDDWIKKKGVTSKGNLRFCDVVGDSMEGLLHEGDIVMIDMGQTSIVDNNVYAIRYSNELRIKRLSKRFDGGLLISSDNKRYADETLTALEAENITVLGRMLWRGG